MNIQGTQHSSLGAAALKRAPKPNLDESLNSTEDRVHISSRCEDISWGDLVGGVALGGSAGALAGWFIATPFLIAGYGMKTGIAIIAGSGIAGGVVGYSMLAPWIAPGCPDS